MTIIDVDASKVRPNIGELINQVYYQNAQIRINRRKRPVAHLVGEPFMQKLSELFAFIKTNEPTLAERFSIICDTDIHQTTA